MCQNINTLLHLYGDLSNKQLGLNRFTLITTLIFYYVKLKNRLSVRLSRLYLGITAWIDIRFASNEAPIFWELEVCF